MSAVPNPHSLPAVDAQVSYLAPGGDGPVEVRVYPPASGRATVRPASARARFLPHTGFRNPACPPQFVPRESIEARTLVVFDEK